MELLPADPATLEAEEFFKNISDAEMKITIADFLAPLGYIQIIDEDSYLSFRNEDLNLNVQVVKTTSNSFRIYIKTAEEFILVDVVRRIEIADTIKNQGIILFREIMMKRGRQLLRQQNLLPE